VKTMDFAREFVFAARKVGDTSDSCCPSLRMPKVASDQFAGWTFSLDVYVHPPPSGDTSIHHYRLSAKLFPPGRGSIATDWQTLGEVVQAIAHATGHPDDKFLEPLVPIADAHPNATIHWMWHSDGSDVDEIVREATVQAVWAMTPRPAPPPPESGPPTPRRNELCPCGSGKKYKKCHAN